MKSASDVHDRIREQVGSDWLQRFRFVDARQPAVVCGDGQESLPADTENPDYDVIMAGGGLSLLLAPLLAAAGLEVAVFDRARVGQVHREWNASGPELNALVHAGLLGRNDVDALVMARYTHGICRWHGGGSYPVVGALDHAVDANGLVKSVRRIAQCRGVQIFDEHSIVAARPGPHGVAVRYQSGDESGIVSGRVLLDARGASSPYARTDLVCPTVGGVLKGLDVGDGPDVLNPQVGEILVTTEHIEHGHQHIWEAFPGRQGECAVYLFYYARSDEVGPGALTALYDRFFSLRPRFKRGAAQLTRPTFGYIPGWSRLSAGALSPHDRIFLVGDAAARHSPLTYCGFGSMLRDFAPTAQRIVHYLKGQGPGGRTPAQDLPIHRVTGALSMLMARAPQYGTRPDVLNALLNDAFAGLHEMPNDAYGRLLRDEISAEEFMQFLRHTARRRPAVYREALGMLGFLSAGRWGLNLLRSLTGARQAA